MFRTCDLGGSCSDPEAMLSPLDEDSSGDSDRNGSTSLGQPVNDHKMLASTESEMEGKNSAAVIRSFRTFHATIYFQRSSFWRRKKAPRPLTRVHRTI